MRNLFTLFALTASVIMSAGQLWPIILDDETFSQYDSNVVGDFRPNDVDNHLYIWSSNETYTQRAAEGLNFYNNDQGYLSLVVAAPQGWSGLGFCIENSASIAAMQQLKSAIVADPDNYFLHIAIKATTPGNHQFYVFGTSATSFAIGTSTIEQGNVIGDFPRDGSWFEFYVPMAPYASAIASADVRSGTNILCILSGAAVGAELDLDAIYFCDADFKELGPSSYNRCGRNLVWEVNDNGELIITGSGPMYDFSYNVSAPWASIANSISSVQLPDSLTSIGAYAFYGFENLTGIVIPERVTEVGEYAFVGCKNLISLEASADVLRKINAEFPLQTLRVSGGELNKGNLYWIGNYYETLKHIDLSSANGVSLCDDAFSGFYKLLQLILPSNLEHIDYHSISGCIELQSIIIPDDVTEIAARAFEDCRSLAQITFAANSSLASIGNWAFYNCHELQNLAIPEGVTEIGKAAFYGCSYMQEVSLPASVQSIGDNAFALCSHMQQMQIRAALPPTIAAKTFEQVSREMPVYVPQNSVNAYKSDPLWGQMNIIGVEEMDALESISANSSNTKQLRNGQLFILRDGKTYTIQGQEVK